MSKSFFDPQVLLPPKIGLSIKEYSEYLQCYDLYVKELEARRSEWKARVNVDERLRREAVATKKTVTKIWETVNQEQGYLAADGQTVAVGVRVAKVSSVLVDVPLVAQKPKSTEEAKKVRAAKRARYKQNLKLRKVKEAAKKTLWTSRLKENQAAIAKAEAKRFEKTREVRRASSSASKDAKLASSQKERRKTARRLRRQRKRMSKEQAGKK